MSGIWVHLSLIFISVSGPLSKGENAHMAGINSEGLKLNITEANSCQEGLYREHQFCCQPCPPGFNNPYGKSVIIQLYLSLFIFSLLQMRIKTGFLAFCNLLVKNPPAMWDTWV